MLVDIRHLVYKWGNHWHREFPPQRVNDIYAYTFLIEDIFHLFLLLLVFFYLCFLSCWVFFIMLWGKLSSISIILTQIVLSSCIHISRCDFRWNVTSIGPAGTSHWALVLYLCNWWKRRYMLSSSKGNFLSQILRKVLFLNHNMRKKKSISCFFILDSAKTLFKYRCLSVTNTSIFMVSTYIENWKIKPF